MANCNRLLLFFFGGLVVLGVGLTSTACGGGSTKSSVAPPAPKEFSQIDLAEGTGTRAGTGAKITVKYTVWVYDPSKPDNKGTKFDSTDDHDPITFTLGAREVIAGWDQGLNGLRVGGKRRLVIPPNLGYGQSGTPDGSIPPNAGLVFDVELVDAK